MRTKDLVIGEYYRHRDSPTTCWAKVLEIVPPRKNGNPHNYIVVKCELVVHKSDSFGFIKHFRISSLIKEK